MKKTLFIAVSLLAGAALIGFIYWQKNKRSIVRHALQDAVVSKSDSLYHLHYDSSIIDEINGAATFYNVALQSDTLQQQMLQSTQPIPPVLFHVFVKEVHIDGADIAGLLTSQAVAARVISLREPVLQIIRTGHDSDKLVFTKEDTLALYRQILGKYNSIRADSINVVNGYVKVTDRQGNAMVMLERINVNLNHFLVDSQHNYSNIISYFIKDLRLSVDTITLPGEQTSDKIILDNLEYDAAKRFIAVNRLHHTGSVAVSRMDIRRIVVSGLNTDAFIVEHKLSAAHVACDGGVLSLSVKPGKARKGDPEMEWSDDFFNHAEVGSVDINNARLLIYRKPEQKPIELEDVQFHVYKKVSIARFTTLSYLLNHAYWTLSVNGFSFYTNDGVYQVSVGPATIINTTTTKIHINGIHLVPLLSEAAYAQKMKQQRDLYTFDFNHIVLSGVLIKRLIADNQLEASSLEVQPLIRIYNDRTLPPDDASIKVGKYPHQSLMQLKTAICIDSIQVKDGLVSYRERGAESGLVGDVRFEHIDATITNFTNIPEKIAGNAWCRLKAKALFLGATPFFTQWDFPLNTTNGSFLIAGRLDSMNAQLLNPLIRPLGLLSVDSGQIDRLRFRVKGNDNRTRTDLNLLYHNLSVSVLKKSSGENDLKKKQLVSILANMVVKNDNPPGEEGRRIVAQLFRRDVHQPFFNVVWKSIFTAAKKTSLGRTE